MSDGAHLLIPFASLDAPAARQALETLDLPHLGRLLASLAPHLPESGDVRSLSTPLERVLARECGMSAPDGAIPWAAWQMLQDGRDPGDAAWAWITPCHWNVASDHISMGHLAALQLDANDSRALLAAMQPYFEQDAIHLEYESPTRWLARGEVFRGLATASLDRVVGQDIDAWIPRGEAARTLRRLQSEMQMLLYTHALSDKRANARLQPVNSFWVSGSGALPTSRSAAPPPGLQIANDLREAALSQDWPAWTTCWTRLDARDCARLATSLDQGQPVALTLCGERGARTWGTRKAGLWRTLRNRLLPDSAIRQLETL